MVKHDRNVKLFFVGIISIAGIAFLSVIVLLQHSTERALTLADSVRVYENSRDGLHAGMPGFFGATRGACLAEGARSDDAYVETMVRDTTSKIEDVRARSIVFIARSAIADTPEGDIADFGGQHEALHLRVLREMDLCGRRLWAVRGSKSPPLDAYRLRTCSANCTSISPKSLALIRITGSTFDSAASPLIEYYARLQIGGFVFVDDYYTHPKVKSAVDSFRFAARVTDPISHIEEDFREKPYIRAAWWQRTHEL